MINFSHPKCKSFEDLQAEMLFDQEIDSTAVKMSRKRKEMSSVLREIEFDNRHDPDVDEE